MTGRSGTLVNAETPLYCPHGGRIAAASAAAAVRIDGQPAHTTNDVFVINGCPNTVNGSPAPCTTVRWTPERGTVLIDGAAVLLDLTDGQCFSADLRPQGRPSARVPGNGVTTR